MTEPISRNTPDPICDADPLARMLAQLRPVPARIDAVALAYAAGRASRRRALQQSWAITLLAVVVAIAGWFRPVGPQPSAWPRPVQLPNDASTHSDDGEPQSIIPTTASAEPSESSSSTAASYWSLREQFLNHGMDSLPNRVSPSPRPEANPWSSLPPEVLAAPHWWR